ncbi:MAG: hypothetical protein ACJ8AT_10940 [Hyalangium sp.]|uniref:hypothetical protein n=1 Tax=Hyalangium sp. TaxID=2028555 RepID=UPI003899A533
MSETRELSDKLKEVQQELRQTREQLDKQRTQGAREQKALREAIDETQREAARLRQRVEKVEARKREQEELSSPRPEISVGAAGMIVALARPPPSLEEAVPVLSRLLRMPPAAVRLRLTRSQPSLLARLPADEAERLGEQLTAEGFSVVLGEYSRLIHRGIRVRRFTLDEETLSVDDGKGELQRVRYQELRLLVRGRRSSTTVEIEIVRQARSRPSEDRSLGDVLRTEHEHLENFLWVYGGDTRMVITEETAFTGLGALRAASRAATWQSLIEELRKRAPHIVIDERFLRTSRLELPQVPSERSQDVIAGLVDAAIQEGMWP